LVIGSLEHFRPVVADVADLGMSFGGTHGVGFVLSQQIHGRLGHMTALQPAVVVAWMQDNGHAIVHLRR